MSEAHPSLQEYIYRCNKCGACMAACPLYAATAREGMAARGKIALLEAALEGRLPVSGRLRARLEDCLLCGACRNACPSLVPTTELFLRARGELARRLGQPFWNRILLSSLGSPLVLGLGAGVLSLVQHAGLDGLCRALVRSPALRVLRAAPRGPAVSYRRRRLPRGDGAGARLAYFAGCFMNWLYPEVAEATHRVLVYNGYRVESPPVVCCGMPHRALGDAERAQALARRNVDLLENYAAVVTDCASCGAALKSYGDILAGDPAYAARARDLAGRVFDVCQFLVAQGYRRPRQPLPVRVTYHDPCHLGRAQGVREDPRRVLGSIRDLELVEMKDADLCCGGGGSFMLTHPVLALQVGRQKTGSAGGKGCSCWRRPTGRTPSTPPCCVPGGSTGGCGWGFPGRRRGESCWSCTWRSGRVPRTWTWTALRGWRRA